MNADVEALIFPSDFVRAEVEALVSGEIEPAWHTSLNADRSRPVWFLARTAGRLTGVLTVFNPTGQAAEVQAWVEPALRRQGVFSGLWAAARRVWDAPDCRWLFVADRGLAEGRAVGLRFGALAFTEKTLVLETECRPPFPGLPDGLLLAEAGPEDAEAAAGVLARANGEPESGFCDFVLRIAGDPRRSLLLLKRGGVPVAVVGLHRNPPTAGLFALAVDPVFQGRGWGRLVVLAALEQGAAGTEEFELEVDSTNGRAEALYRSLGFTDRKVTDYFEIKENKRAQP